MLRKEDSNKVLKGIKAVVFAGVLSLSCPMNAEAEEVNYQETAVVDEEVDSLRSLKIMFGVSFLMCSPFIGGTILEIKKFAKELENSEAPIFLGKLSDGSSNDDVNEAVKCLKLVNGLEAKNNE